MQVGGFKRQVVFWDKDLFGGAPKAMFPHFVQMAHEQQFFLLWVLDMLGFQTDNLARDIRSVRYGRRNKNQVLH